jgi:rhodanese-related sulfurtransferase
LITYVLVLFQPTGLLGVNCRVTIGHSDCRSDDEIVQRFLMCLLQPRRIGPMTKSARFERLVADAKSRVREISPAEADEQRVAGAVLIDVREPDEFAKAHSAGAIHLSRGVLELRIEEAVPDLSTPILCYCGGGSRSALAADSLQKMGYTNVASVAGGFKAWKDQGHPTS